MRDLIRVLRDFLKKTSYNNLAIRKKRFELVMHICDEVLQLASEIQKLPPGWSTSPECRLNASEQHWLDPCRARMDPDFAKARSFSNWADVVSKRFGRWLNDQLRTDRTLMGDAEYQEWQRLLKKELRMIRSEICDND